MWVFVFSNLKMRFVYLLNHMPSFDRKHFYCLRLHQYLVFNGYAKAKETKISAFWTWSKCTKFCWFFGGWENNCYFAFDIYWHLKALLIWQSDGELKKASLILDKNFVIQAIVPFFKNLLHFLIWGQFLMLLKKVKANS